LPHLVVGATAGFVLLAISGLAFIPSSDQSPANIEIGMIAGVVAVGGAAALHLVLEFVLSHSREASLRSALQMVRRRQLVIESPGGDPTPPPPRRWWVVIGLVAVFIPAGLMLTPLANVPPGGWPANPDCWWTTGALGPGSEAIVPMGASVESIDGIYGYAGQVDHLNAQECGRVFGVVVQPYDFAPISDRIEARSREGAVKTADVTIKLRLPNDPDLFGKTVRLRITAVVKHPVWAGPKTYTVAEKRVAREITLYLVQQESAQDHRRTFQIASILAACTYLFGVGVLLLGNTRRRVPQLPVEVRQELPPVDSQPPDQVAPR
jgi:hypothetical protein